MDSNYRSNIGKWLPQVSESLETFFTNSLLLCEKMEILARRITFFLKNVSSSGSYDQNDLKNLIKSLEAVIPEYQMIPEVEIIKSTIFHYKFEHCTNTLKKNVNIVARFTKNLIDEMANGTNTEFLRMIFRLVNVYNDLISFEHDMSNSSVNIFYNDCPNMMEPLKKFSVSRILQVLAKNRAEGYCHELIDCLLANYRSSCDEDDTRFDNINDSEISENSSIEIYRTLTKHLTPPIIKSTAQEAFSNVESIQTLVNTQNEQVIKLLNIVKIISPQLLGSDATKIDNDEIKIRKVAMKKITEFYQEVAWGSVSNILDHVVLWWSPEALATRHSHGSQHLKDWMHQFIRENDIPPTVRPALQTLCDALGCHVTITAWDQFFRLAYTASFQCQSRPLLEDSEYSRSLSMKGTDTGRKFVDVFHLLMTLSNECEIGGEWVMGAPLIELPLSEQIIVLHRMDHSVHTMRLWSMQESRMIAHTWELEVFFLIVKGDIVNCLEMLSRLKLADYTQDLDGESISVQVYVCGKMRAKIVSEVSANILLLKEAPVICIQILAKIARIMSLANLHMCFPKSIYWRQTLSIVPHGPSSYVEIYFERVLLPVLLVTEDTETSNMILRIMCEAWLDYIYLHKIKFSEWGALQLLADFAHVLTWVTNSSIISEKVRPHLLKNEVLRRCEGVGRLLLRHPGEAISMNKKLPQRTDGSGSPESLGLERMPAEMYVPNQEQWLELRAPKRYFCCAD